MGSPWRPEREISEQEATEAVRALGLTGDDVRQVASGWDNTIISVDHAWLFRFPRRAMALPGVERELAHLPRLAQTLPLPIPVPEHHGTTGEPPWPFWGAQALPGTELAVSQHADVEQVAATMGRFLRTLHDQPVDPSLPVDPLRRSDAADRAVRARRLLAGLADAHVVHPHPKVDALLDEAEGLGPSDAPPVTTHGDLYARHVLVDADGRASGVIDWGDVCAAPPAVDLSFVWSSLLPQHRPAFWREYGDVDEGTALRARALAVFMLATVASYAHDSRLDVLLTSTLTNLAAVAD